MIIKHSKTEAGGGHCGLNIIKIIKELTQETIGSICGTRGFLAWPEGQEVGICV